jgi:hypothetical protein
MTCETFHELHRLVERLVNTGILDNYIDSAKIINQHSQEQLEIVIEPIEGDHGVPDRWKRYEFERVLIETIELITMIENNG